MQNTMACQVSKRWWGRGAPYCWWLQEATRRHKTALLLEAWYTTCWSTFALFLLVPVCTSCAIRSVIGCIFWLSFVLLVRSGRLPNHRHVSPVYMHRHVWSTVSNGSTCSNSAALPSIMPTDSFASKWCQNATTSWSGKIQGVSVPLPVLEFCDWRWMRRFAHCLSQQLQRIFWLGNFILPSAEKVAEFVLCTLRSSPE
jgi:hypothetical protein